MQFPPGWRRFLRRLSGVAYITKENSFLKNLGRKVASDDEFLKSAGGLVVGIAAAGVIPSFTQAVSADIAIIATGGAWAATKIAATYDECREHKKEIERKDM